jgi:RES domain-containing protein
VRRLPWDSGPPELWRLDVRSHATSWDSGKGAELAGGRWNPEGTATVYCSTDPSTAILEVAVHKGFAVLDRVPHVLTEAVVDARDVHVVTAENLPNAHWLSPAPPSHDQQLFGKSLLEAHTFVVLPSAVCPLSWNVIFNPARAAGRYQLREQQPFSLDTRLNPPR